MPELPEVEVVRRCLLNHLPGRTLTNLSTDGKKMRLPVPVKALKSLTGSRITDIRRRAKYLLIEMDNGAVMVVHLGMTGILGLFPEGADIDPHDHIRWNLDNGYELRFNDVRRFGSIRVVEPDQAQALEQTIFKANGPEPFSETFDGSYLYKKARKKQQPVKNFIMDGRVVAGVGNIYANESLFSAGISPVRKAGAISEKRYTLLVEKIRKVFTTAIECGGSTISDFLDASGTKGYFQIHFNVYGRRDLPCPICRTPIRHVKLGGRASFFCPACQR